MDRFVKKAVAVFLAVVMLLSTAPVAGLDLWFGNSAVSAVDEIKADYVIGSDDSIDIELKCDEETVIEYNSKVYGRYVFTCNFCSDYSPDYSITLRDHDGNFISNDWKNVTEELKSGRKYYYYVSYCDDKFETLSATVSLQCEEEHTNIVEVPQTDATCTENGYTKGTFCEDCEMWLDGHETIVANHTDANDDNICDVCGEKCEKVLGSGVCGDDAYWTFFKSGKLVIKGRGRLYDFYYSEPWNKFGEYDDDDNYHSNIKEIVIESGITNLSYNVFNGANDIKVVLSDTVSNVELAFSSCSFNEFVVDKNNKKYSSLDGNLMSKDQKTLLMYADYNHRTEYTVPESVDSLDMYSFSELRHLKNVTCLPTITELNNFYGFDEGESSSLETVTVYAGSAIHERLLDAYDENYEHGYNLVLKTDKPGIYFYRKQPKTRYYLEDKFVAPDIIFVSQSGEIKHLSTDDYSISGFDTSVTGEATLTISYAGYNLCYDISVASPGFDLLGNILLGETKSLRIESEESTTGYRFVPNESGIYTVSASGKEKACLSIMNSELIGLCNDVPLDRVPAYMTAGEVYYITATVSKDPWTGKPTIAMPYSVDITIVKGNTLKSNETSEIVDIDNKKVNVSTWDIVNEAVVAEYGKPRYDDYAFLFNAGNGMIAYQLSSVNYRNAKYGFINIDNNSLLKLPYDGVLPFNSLGYAVVVKNNGEDGKRYFGLIDKTGKEILPCEYNSLSMGEYEAAGLIAASKEIDGKVLYGYIDIDGNTVIDFKYLSASAFDPIDGKRAVVKLENGKYAVIDRDEKILKIFSDEYTLVGNILNAMVYVEKANTDPNVVNRYDEQAEKVSGMINLNDNEIIPVKYVSDIYSYYLDDETGKDNFTFYDEGSKTFFLCDGNGTVIKTITKDMGVKFSSFDSGYALIAYAESDDEPFKDSVFIMDQNGNTYKLPIEAVDESVDYGETVGSITGLDNNTFLINYQSITGYYRSKIVELSYEDETCDHDYQKVVTPAPCETDGKAVYTCSKCSDSYTEVIPATGHKIVVDKAVAATCTETGLTGGEHCSVCGKVLQKQEVVEAKGHNYQNGICVDCGDKVSDHCNCQCHKVGIGKLIWKIIRIFYKIFRLKPVCKCGVKHY